MISYRKPIFLWQRGFRLQLVTKLSVCFFVGSAFCFVCLLRGDALVLQVKQQGNTAGSHCAYFYRKVKDDSAAAAPVPVAVATVDAVQPEAPPPFASALE